MKPLIALALASLLTPAASHAAATACPTHYAQGAAPDINNPAMLKKARELCAQSFGVMHSGVTRTPLWSAEYLTPSLVAAAERMERKASFYAESRLPADERADLNDYKGSGYDRGHMSPSGDMPDSFSQQQSFTLANMVPQAAKINQGIWASIERAVRNEVSQGRSLYVMTGPMFEGASLEQLNARVLVPSSVFKAVYDPQAQTAAAYVASNAKDARGKKYDVITISELEQRLRINLFPAMPARVKKTQGQLPKPMNSRFEP